MCVPRGENHDVDRSIANISIVVHGISALSRLKFVRRCCGIEGRTGSPTEPPSRKCYSGTYLGHDAEMLGPQLC
jgi:hypothetical protein